MTPEQIDEVKRRAARDTPSLKAGIDLLLAARKLVSDDLKILENKASFGADLMPQTPDTYRKKPQ